MLESRNSERTRKQGKIVCLLICLFFICSGVFLMARASKYLLRRFTCTETVTAAASAPNTSISTSAKGKKKTTYYHPVLHYTYQNRTYDVYYEFSARKNYYPAGTEVEIHIDPDDPNEFYIADDPILRRELQDSTFILLAGAVPLALYFLATRTNLLNKEIGRNRFPGEAGEERLRLALEKRRLKMERAAEKHKRSN